MKRKVWKIGLAVLLVSLAIGMPTGAQPPEPQYLYGHDNHNHTIVRIDTSTGLATVVGPTNFTSGASGLATARGYVPGPGGTVYLPGTQFGLLRDQSLGQDFVVAVDTTTGQSTKVVQTQRTIGDRGIAFGPDGTTLFLMEDNRFLSTIDTVTGAVTPVGYTRYRDDSLEFDPDTATFYAIPANTLININPSDGSATVVSPGGLGDVRSCTIVRSPAGTWYTVDILTKELVTIDIKTGTVGTVIGNLGPNVSSNICGTAFAPEGSPVPSLPVPVDVKPRGCPNPLNVVADVLPVAILGTGDLDVTEIDPASVRLEGVAPLRWSINDVATPYEPFIGKGDAYDCTELGADGYADLTIKFDAQEIVATLGEIQDGDVLVLQLIGNLKEAFGGAPIVGEDVILIIKK